ncbi:Uncharacterised protein [Klebsiella pneumoniae]|nr:Uncharacterised protein [Klebsiella pneumoniae]
MQVIVDVGQRTLNLLRDLVRFPPLISQTLICSCSFQSGERLSLVPGNHEGDTVSFVPDEVFTLKADDVSTCFRRFNGSVIAVVAVDNFHALLGNLDVQRRHRLASDKRIAELSDVILVDFADVQAGLDVQLFEGNDKRPVHLNAGSVFIFLVVMLVK